MNINISVSSTPEELGKKAAAKIAELLRDAIVKKGHARMILSTGQSQFETLAALVKEDVDWSKVEMFHLDEYVALPESHGASFRKYLKERFVSKVNLKAAYFVNGEGDVERNIEELTKELRKDVVDVGVIGIGENGHIAFNDPHEADFHDPKRIKKVALDNVCRNQQVHDGCFRTLDEVPEYAITLTCPTLFSADRIFCVVPSGEKARAVEETVKGPVSEKCPATILRKHPAATMYVDAESGKYIV